MTVPTFVLKAAVTNRDRFVFVSSYLFPLQVSLKRVVHLTLVLITSNQVAKELEIRYMRVAMWC